jgi:glycosyltransferase involved in cell wall biosynthesis
VSCCWRSRDVADEGIESRRVAIHIAVSVSEAAAAELVAGGPRRDFLELARVTGGDLLYQTDGTSRRGWRGKLLGPHVRQAWKLAARARANDVLFADGEHIGLPLCLLLGFRRKRSVRAVVLVHFADRWWKRLALRLASRMHGETTLVVHSLLQRDIIRGAVGGRWRTELVPYQVDTLFWAECGGSPQGKAQILAVGSEHRDYDSLCAAVEGIDADVVIAAGSHWARRIRGARALPPNVTYLSQPLRFWELREAYQRATVVVVPLEDVTNQSGVTVMLEAMSMCRPVVVTASRGQRECISGPLVQPDGTMDMVATADRGPQAFGFPKGTDRSGLYCSPHDPDSLRQALTWVIEHREEAQRMASSGRQACLAHFTVEAYVERLGELIRAHPAPQRVPDFPAVSPG